MATQKHPNAIVAIQKTDNTDAENEREGNLAVKTTASETDTQKEKETEKGRWRRGKSEKEKQRL